MTDAFPFRFPPYKHQAREFEQHKDDDARALLWSMRTGKTKAVIDFACYRHSVRRDLDAVLVIAPNGVHSNWIRRELPSHMWVTIPWVGHTWRTSERDKAAHVEGLAGVMNCPGKLPWLAINAEAVIHEDVKKAIAAFIKRRRVLLVVDESQDFRTPGSRRTMRVRGLASKCAMTRILTGSVTSNSPLAAYSQYELLAPGALGFTTFGAFKSHFAEYRMEMAKNGREFPVLAAYKNLDELQGRMAEWSSVVLRDEVDDMPELLMMLNEVELSDEQARAYEKIRTQLIYEIESMTEAELTLEHGAKRLTKLQQVLSGFVIDDTGVVHSLVPDEANPRLQMLERDVELTDGKFIVWCQFREDIRRVAGLMRRMGIGFVEYHGLVPRGLRDGNIDQFMTDPNTRGFIGQPKAGGKGLNLSAAHTIYNYSHTQDLIDREQSIERATAIKGASVSVLDFVTPSTVDTYILACLAKKEDVTTDLSRQGLRARLLEVLSGRTE